MANLTKQQQIEKLKVLEERHTKDVDKSISTRDICAYELADIDTFLDRHKPLEGQWSGQSKYHDAMVRTLNSGGKIHWSNMTSQILAENPSLMFIN